MGEVGQPDSLSFRGEGRGTGRGWAAQHLIPREPADYPVY